jgi:hypothetical protein
MENTNIFTEEEVRDRVALSLNRISKKFPVAYQLATIIKEIGLFTGKAYMDEQGCNFIPDTEGDQPLDCEPSPDGNSTMFGCFVTTNEWRCYLRIDKHFVIISFDLTTGKIIRVIPDIRESPFFWKAEHEYERIQNILLLAKDRPETENRLSREEVEDKVAFTLRKLKSKFISADYIAGFVDKCGLYNGIVTIGNYNTISFRKWRANQWKHPYCKAHFVVNKDGSLSDTEICDIEAGCVKVDGEWKCRLGFGLLTSSYVELTFNTRTGELNNIDFDKDKAPKFKNSEFWEGWLTNSTEGRIKEIQSLL